MKSIVGCLMFLSSVICYAPTGTSYDIKDQRITSQDNQRKEYISVFSDLMTESRRDSVSVQFLYNIPSDIVQTSVVNGGSVVHDPDTMAMAKVSTSTNNAGFASINSTSPLRYTPGHEAYAYFTVVYNAGVANSTQWAGVFDDVNGFAIGYNGTQFSILYRRGLIGQVTEQLVSQNQFNIDRLDGSGASLITINPQKINIFRITYGWLGTSPIMFEVCRQDGVWFPFHKIYRANISDVPSVYNPILPVRMEVKNNGNASNVILKTASWCAGTLGEGVAFRNQQHSVMSKRFGNSGDLIFAIRNNTLINGKTNRATINLVHAEFAVGGTLWSSSLARFRFVKNPTITGANWVSQDSNISVVDYTDRGVVTGGCEQLVVPFLAKAARNLSFLTNQLLITLQPGETLAIIGATDTAISDCDLSLVWQETIG